MVHTVDVAAGWDDYSDDTRKSRWKTCARSSSRITVVTETYCCWFEDVAELLLERVADSKIEPSKLQVLCYLVQGHHLASTGHPPLAKRFSHRDGPIIDVLATVGSDFSGIRGQPRLAGEGPALECGSDPEWLRVTDRGRRANLRELARNQAPWIEAYQNAKVDGRLIAPGLMRNYFAFQLSVPFDPAH